MRLLGFWFVVVGFMLVSGVLFSGGLNPGAMFVGWLCSAALERDETRRLVALAVPTEITSVHWSSSISIGVVECWVCFHEMLSVLVVSRWVALLMRYG